MKRFFSLMGAVIAVCGLFSSCESYDAGELEKTNILGTWYESRNSKYVFNEDGSYEYYAYSIINEEISGTFGVDYERNTWVQIPSNGTRRVYTIVLLSETTFVFIDKDGNNKVWVRNL